MSVNRNGKQLPTRTTHHRRSWPK